jgi:hypothetical protein
VGITGGTVTSATTGTITGTDQAIQSVQSYEVTNNVVHATAQVVSMDTSTTNEQQIGLYNGTQFWALDLSVGGSGSQYSAAGSTGPFTPPTVFDVYTDGTKVYYAVDGILVAQEPNTDALQNYQLQIYGTDVGNSGNTYDRISAYVAGIRGSKTFAGYGLPPPIAGSTGNTGFTGTIVYNPGEDPNTDSMKGDYYLDYSTGYMWGPKP